VRHLVLAALVVTIACGPGQAQPPASPTSEAATPSAPASSLVFGALEADGTANPEQWNAVAIAGLDGHARAKTSFAQMPVPNVGCISAVLPSSAHVAAGKVYFADGTGVVRSLSVGGQITEVTSFPFKGPQQMLSFAVSPDGARLMGAVFTLPSKPNLACGGAAATSGYSLDVYWASAGGPSNLFYHQGLTSTDVLAFAGWDEAGPFGTFPTEWASQGGGPRGFFGTPVRIDSLNGKVLKQVSDPAVCMVWDIGPKGDFTCIPAGTDVVSVRRPDGSEIWQVGPSPNGSYYFLAPDEQHVLAMGQTGLEVLGRDATRLKLPGGFFPEGWLDAATVIGTPIGAKGRGNLGFVRTSAPDIVVDMGFKGLFLGTVQG
jgi:hypothetical protein